MRPGSWCCAIAIGLAASGAGAAGTDVAEPPTEKARPRVALVLSGGGARGFAHVGVLRALAEMQVPVDMVVGVSMGAVVGGAYASGRKVEDLERFVRTTDWAAIVADRPPRDELAFRRRQDDLLVPSRIEFGVGAEGVRLPPSTAGNGALENALMQLLPEGSAGLPVNRLALPFSSAASDLLSGEMVVLAETPLFMSLRASLSVPGVFAPVRVNGRLLIDGGLVRNLPIDLARAMGAEIVIAVNVGTPLAGESALGDALGVARQMLSILTEQNVQRSLKELGPDDVLIAPDLEGISFLNFSLAERAMAAGAEATRRVAQRLQPLAVSAERYAAIEAARSGTPLAPEPALPLARLEVQGTTRAGSDALAAQSGLGLGLPVTLTQVQRAAARLFGRGEFERVGVDIGDRGGAREVVFTPEDAGWAQSRVRIGLELVSDFADDHRFTVSGLHVLSWVNPWGAELRTLARIGSERLLSTQFWQPLAPGSDWYVAPVLQYRASAVDVYAQGRRSLRVGYELSTAALTFGRQLADWGNAQLGVERRSGRGHSLVTPDAGAGASEHFRETAYFGELNIDTLDSLALPGRGGLLLLYAEDAAATSTSSGHTTASALGLVAFRSGAWDGHLYGEWGRARRGAAPVSLGGFLRLSGTPRDSVSDNEVVFGRLVMARRIGAMPTGLGGAVRAGYSIELGAGRAADTSFDDGGIKRAGSVFVAVDTRFGPVFLALGATRGVGGAMYLFLGPFW